ncbi:MAG: hypothetical protein AAF282_20055 [Cyanobacteria bacterium P01_A01_bin.15]
MGRDYYPIPFFLSTKGPTTPRYAPANVYEQSFTAETDIDSSKAKYQVFEDGRLLTLVVDEAACDGTPGSYYFTTFNDGAPCTVGIHTTNSNNPNSNGSVYGVSRRIYGFAVGDNATVKNLHARRALANNGCAEIGDGSTTQNCVFEDGHVHNALFGYGTVRNCWSYGWNTSNEVGGASAFIGYTTAETNGPNYEFLNCIVINKNSVNTRQGTGFYVHGQALGNIGSVLYQDCEAYYSGALHAGAADNTGQIISRRCLAYECNVFGGAGGNEGGFPYLSEDDEYYRTVSKIGTSSPTFSPGPNAGSVIKRLKSFQKNSDFVKSFASAGDFNLTIEDSSIVLSTLEASDRGWAFLIEANNDSKVPSLNSSRNAFVGWDNFGYLFLDSDITNISAVVSDNNAIEADNSPTQLLGSTYSTITALNIAQPQLEASSQRDANIGLLDPSARDYTASDGSIVDVNNWGGIGPDFYQSLATYSSRLAQVQALINGNVI